MVMIIAILTLALLYWFPLRRWFARWGTTTDEIARAMPGDSLIAGANHSATHAVTVYAAPEDIWPWLAQMGYQRGGLYSYDWLDRLFGFLDRPSADRIVAEFQTLSVGDHVQLGPDERNRLTVALAEPPHALVLSYGRGDFQWVWQFGLYELDQHRTRLVTRGTERVPKSVALWLFMRIMEPAAFIMTRRMLLGLKQRAEALRAQRAARPDCERQVA